MKVDGKDYLFISDTKTGNATASTTTTISLTPGDASAEAPFAYGATFSVGGWYTITSGGTPVPEPTSGLLMLLGIAGLALKRKRA